MRSILEAYEGRPKRYINPQPLKEPLKGINTLKGTLKGTDTLRNQ